MKPHLSLMKGVSERVYSIIKLLCTYIKNKVTSISTNLSQSSTRSLAALTTFIIMRIRLILALCLAAIMIENSQSMLMYYRKLRPVQPMETEPRREHQQVHHEFHTIIVIITYEMLSFAGPGNPWGYRRAGYQWIWRTPSLTLFRFLANSKKRWFHQNQN